MAKITVTNKQNQILDVLTQWDTNQTCYFETLGLTSPPQVHFCNSKWGEALRVQSETATSGKYKVKIPNILLTQPYDITGYIYLVDSEETKTTSQFHICVTPRNKPDDFLYVENINSVSADSISKNFASQLQLASAHLSNIIDRRVEMLLGKIGGLELRQMAKSEYDEIEPDESTIYFVTDDNGKIKQYLGATELSSGSKPATASVSVVGLYPKIGNATKEE